MPEAVEQFAAAAQLAPTDGVMLGNYAYALSTVGRIDEAIAAARRAVELAPGNGYVWLQLAECYWRGHRYDEAIEPARRGMELLGDRADARNHVVFGNVMHTAGEFDQTAAAYRRAIELDPNNFDAHSNLALVLLKSGEARESLERYNQIIARWPQKRDSLANRSLALLMLGELQRGFAEYEARWTPDALKAHERVGSRWDGSDPRGKTLLLSAEQGYGDTIHFVRYATLIAQQGATVVVSCQPEVEPVVRTVPGVSQVLKFGDATSIKFDAMIPLASLPRVMGTTLDTIPATVPYVSADPDRVRAWRERLAAARGDGATVKVGIVWAGSGLHQNDRIRSCTLADLAPLAGVEGVSLYSLQKGAPAKQLESPPPGLTITPLGDELKDFGDSAALLEALDLLISVDTSVVHLAGALARPVWTLLARGPDWRWMLDREDSPWYPTMRLFRQQALKDWKPVIEHVADELRKFVAAAITAKGTE